MKSLKGLKGTGKIEFNVCVSGLTANDIKEALKDVFPEIVLNKSGNLILDLREDPVNTKNLLIENLFCSSSDVIWQDGGFTEEQLTAMMQ